MLCKLKSKTSIEFWVISALFIMGLLVRLYRLGVPSLGDDEILTAIKINHSLLDTIGLLGHSSFPPLHYVILNLWVHAFGNGEWALRFPSAIFSSLTIIVIYKLGKELFSKDVGLISAALLAFSPFAVHYAQFAKMYALFWFLAAGSFLFFFRFLKDQGKSSYKFYIITSILCCYTMYAGFLFLLTQSIIFLLFGERTRWKKWFAGQLIVLSFCIPWIIFFLSSKHDAWGLMRPSAAFNYFRFSLNAFLFIIGSSFEIWTRESWAQFSFKLCLWKINCFLYVFLIVFFLIDVLTISYKNKKMGIPLPKNYYCLLIWIITPIFFYFMFDYFVVRAFLVSRYRYIGFLQVPIILLVSSQINNLQGLFKKILVLVIVVIAMNSAYLYSRDNLSFPQQDWRTAAKKLTQNFGENDIVLSFVPIPQFKYYYKGDTRRFFMISSKDCSSEFLVRKGILTPNVHSIFILYKERLASEIQLNGFFLDYKVGNRGIGFLHFRRAQSKSVSGK